MILSKNDSIMQNLSDIILRKITQVKNTLKYHEKIAYDSNDYTTH